MDDQPRVAGDVGPAILGQSRRRKDGRWDWLDSGRRSLEAAVASWVVDILEKEGYRVADLWSPDYDRGREPGRRTRPELAMTLDGEPAALDVTMFTTNESSRAGGRGATIRQSIEARLQSFDDGRSILGVVGFDSAGLNALTRREVQEAAGLLADAFEAAVRAVAADAQSVKVAVSYPWLREAAITISIARPGMSRASIYVRESRGDLGTQVDSFLLERLDKKAAQLRPWGRGILVIVHGLDETAEDLRAGFRRLGRSPFWRVYWAGPSPELVELVASEN